MAKVEVGQYLRLENHVKEDGPGDACLTRLSDVIILFSKSGGVVKHLGVQQLTAVHEFNQSSLERRSAIRVMIFRRLV